jgi:putative LysE/RhtB family amino acid efflux pump
VLAIAGMFLKGLAFGLALAAPVGPMALLCLRATLTRGVAGGVTSGLGTATGDAVLAGAAAFGLGAASFLSGRGGTILALLGGTYLLWFGARTLWRPPAPPGGMEPLDVRGAAGVFGRAFVLTLANPPTLMIFAALFAGLGLAGTGTEPLAGAAVVAGVFLGSLGWWIGLAAAVGRLGAGLGTRRLTWINRVSGLALVGFGAYAVARAAWP